jgi:holo-[acyl-carrier protein] synthase
VIHGIGTDVVEVARIEAVYRRFGDHFVRRLLMPEEERVFGRRAAGSPARTIRFLAQRFAAKEAIVKALGTGFAHGMWIRDCGFVPNEWGRPDVVWSARGRKVKEALAVGAGHVTLTDEAGLVVAVAVLEKAA